MRQRGKENPVSIRISHVIHTSKKYRKQKGESNMQKFNQMTEDQMSQVDGGIAMAVAMLVVGIVSCISGLVSTGLSVANTAKSK